MLTNSTLSRVMLLIFNLVFFFNTLPATSPENTDPLFQLTKNQIEKSDELSDAIYLQLDTKKLQSIYQQKQTTLSLELPINENETIVIQLDRKTPIAKDFVLKQQAFGQKSEKAYAPGVYYQGQVKGQKNSLAAITFFKDKLMGVISYNGENYNLGRISSDSNIYLFYPEKNILNQKTFECHTPDVTDLIPTTMLVIPPKSMTSKTVKVYFECDYEMYQDFGNNVTNVTDYVTAMFNVVQAVYAIDDICIEISEIMVWTQNDPYSSNSSGEALDDFIANLSNAFNGDLAHLLSTSNNNNGGVAYLDVLCNSSIAHAYSNISGTYNQLPNYSWTIDVVAHELGHNLGAPHTHSCSWPGGAIDNCFCPEGDCNPGPEPDNSGGTLMSYCHLSSSPCNDAGNTNPGKNLSLGLGPLPAALIYNNIETSACLGNCGDNNGGDDDPDIIELPCACNDSNPDICDDLEVYQTGFIGPQSLCWTTWSGNEGTIEEGMLTDEQAASGQHSVKIEGSTGGGPQDAVFMFGNYTSGHYELSFQLFVESNSAAYYNIQHTFPPSGNYEWASDVFFNPDGTGSLNAGTANVATFIYPQNSWISIVQDIDLDNDLTSLYINGNLVHSWPFSYQSNATIGTNALAAIDFYPTDQNNVFFIDDISLTAVETSNFLQISPSNQTVNWQANSIDYQVDANVNWTVIGDVNWLTLNPDDANGSGTITATFEENTSTESRMATITLNGGGLTQTATLIQQGTSPILAISPNNQTVDWQSGTTDFQVNSNANWTVNEDADWLTLNPDDASGNGNFTATFEENLEGYDRTATITLNGGGLTQTATITQLRLTTVLGINPNDQTVDWQSGTTDFQVSANVDWTVTDDANWLTLSPDDDNGNGSFTATFEENPIDQNRIATITLSGGGLTKTATITQLAFAAYLGINPDSKTVDWPNGTFEFEVNSNINWTVSEDTNWLSLNLNNDSGNGTFIVTFDENTTEDNRFATITLTGSGLTQTATITQLAFNPFLTLSPGSQQVGAPAGSVSFTVNSNINWTVEDDASWLTLDPDDANGNVDFTATFEENTSVENRIATITLSGGGITQTATLTQTGSTVQPLSLSTLIIHESCFNESDGIIDLDIFGGLPPYDFEWNNGEVTEDINGLSGGTFSCIITDASGSIINTENLVVLDAPELFVTFQTTPSENNDGSAMTFVNNGIGPYSYVWNTDPVQTDATAANLSTGDYTVTITDLGLDCSYEYTVTIDSYVSTNDLNSLNHFNLYPNPSDGFVQIDILLDETKPIELNIYSVLGQRLWSQTVTTNTINNQLDLSTWANGVYFVEMRIGDGILVKKLVLGKGI